MAEIYLNRLHETIAATCPIIGVALLDADTKDVRIDFAGNATQQQKTAAFAALSAYDWSVNADAAWKNTKEPDIATLRDQATQAVSDINTFLAIASPTNAQVLAEVKAIDQRQRAIIKTLARLAAKMI